MKRHVVISILTLACFLLCGCGNYEKRKGKMQQSVRDYKEAQIQCGNEKYVNLDKLSYTLDRYKERAGIGLNESCLMRDEACRAGFDSLQQMEDTASSISDNRKKLNSERWSLVHIKSILVDTDSINYDDVHASVLSGYLVKALADLNKKSNPLLPFLSMLSSRSANMELMQDEYCIILQAYYDVFQYLISEPEECIDDYCDVVLKTIKKFSKKLEKEEFYTIYRDMLNSTAVDCLGNEIVGIINTYEKYDYVTDKDTMFDKYSAISIN